MKGTIEEIDDRATDIVNGYIKYWGTDESNYKLSHLDKLYYYLIYLHNSGKKNIFEAGEEIYVNLIMIKPD